ncbi:MAG: hypothetical protein MUF31_02695 [Akkermansiaceae bacterium]|nr:hypothetical protein [Akkermansiaceae bacterium]
MADQAKVTSIEALEDFRSALLRYRDRTVQALDDVGGEIKRTRDWLAYDRRMFWEAEVRRGQRRLEQAEAELMTSRFSALKDDHSVQQLAVKKARRMLEEAEAKLRAVRKWSRDFDGVVEPAARPLEALRERLSHEFPKAVASLEQMIHALADYSGRLPARATAPKAGTDEGNPASEGGPA